MAKLTGPLMSMNARGQIGKTLVMSGWKGIKTARQYVVPANPKTTAQVAQRARVTTSSQFWASYVTGILIKTAWNRLAAAMATPMSGFNAFMIAAVAAIKNATNELFLVNAEFTADVVTFSFKATSGEDPDVVNVDLWGGATAQKLAFIETLAITTGDATHALSTLPAYISFKAEGEEMSGVIKTADIPEAP